MTNSAPYNTQHYDFHHTNTQQNDIQHNNTKVTLSNNGTQQNDIQHWINIMNLNMHSCCYAEYVNIAQNA